MAKTRAKRQKSTTDPTPAVPQHTETIATQTKPHSSPKQKEKGNPTATTSFIPNPTPPPTKKNTKSTAKKNKSKAGPSSQPSPANTFHCAAAAERFQKLKSKKLWSERGFLPASFELPEFITSVIEKHHWDKFCLKPQPACVPLVREFYSNLVTKDCSSVMVRGSLVSFSAETINDVYGLPPSIDSEYPALVAAPKAEIFDEVLRLIAIPTAAWSVSSTGRRTLAYASVNPEASVWLAFIKWSLQPVTHDTTVNQDRALLLYCILAGKSINVGQLIRREILDCAKKSSGRLFFPALITQLCMKAGIQVGPSEELLHSRTDFDLVSIHRMQNHNAKADRGKAPMSDGPCTATTNAMLLSFLYTRLEYHEQQQRAYFEYVKKRDAALIKSLQRNFTKPTVPFPQFPDDILKEWINPMQPEAPCPSDADSED